MHGPGCHQNMCNNYPIFWQIVVFPFSEILKKELKRNFFWPFIIPTKTWNYNIMALDTCESSAQLAGSSSTQMMIYLMKTSVNAVGLLLSIPQMI